MLKELNLIRLLMGINIVFMEVINLEMGFIGWVSFSYTQKRETIFLAANNMSKDLEAKIAWCMPRTMKSTAVADIMLGNRKYDFVDVSI